MYRLALLKKIWLENGNVLLLNFKSNVKYRLGFRHVFANPPECHILASYQMCFAKNSLKNSRKSQKSPIFDKKCSCLVMLSSGSTEIWFQPELPGLYILHQELVIFGIFLKYPPTTSGSSPKCDILEGWAVHVWTRLRDLRCEKSTVTCRSGFEAV